MRLKTIASLVLVAGTAHAHTHLESSVPADKSKVRAPQAIELRFTEPARVTALTIQQGTNSAKDLKPPSTASKVVSVPVSGLAAGDYKVSWRVAGQDGHVMSGSFLFTVDPAAPAANVAPAPSSHDHGKQGTHQH